MRKPDAPHAPKVPNDAQKDSQLAQEPINQAKAAASSHVREFQEPQLNAETPIEDTPLPAYSEIYGQVDFSQDGFNTNAKVASKCRARKFESLRIDRP